MIYSPMKGKEMNNDFNNCSGTLKVSENVITEIAVNAVSETDGVALYNSLKSFGLGNQPPVTVKITDGSAEITVLLGINMVIRHRYVRKMFRKVLNQAFRI